MSSLTGISLISEIGLCESLFVDEINAPREGALHLILREGGSSSQVDPTDFEDGVLSPKDLVPKARRAFELTWNRCVAYAATDETYAPVERIIDEPTYTGRWFESFDQSRFLRYIAETTFAVEHHSLVLEHVRVRSYSWVVDVISDQPLQVRELQLEYR